MTAPRASLLRRLSWWLRGGPARAYARSCRRSGIPAGDAAILGWCIMANSTIVLLPFGVAVAIVLGAVRGSQQPPSSPSRALPSPCSALLSAAQEPRP